MLFTLPSAISDSAAQPLNALSAIDATDEGSVTSARAEHPSNVLRPDCGDARRNDRPGQRRTPFESPVGDRRRIFEETDSAQLLITGQQGREFGGNIVGRAEIERRGTDCAASLATTDCNASAEIVCSPTVRT